MKRDFYDTLLEWKNKFIETPLMVVGARQVGKTYLIDKFCKSEFSDYIYINLMESPKIIDIFATRDNTYNKVKKMVAEIKREISEDTIIFIDEVQLSEDIISAMKYFAEAEFPYKIIVAGSLLGVKLNRFKSSFPVGKVIMQYMYPMSFKEFLFAINKGSFVSLINDCYKDNKQMVSPFHEELLADYRNYLCTGGMPKMIDDFVQNGESLINQHLILRNIIDSYIADMKMYTSNINETNKIERIYNTIPNQIAKENKKFQFSKINKNARFRDYESAYEWLLSSKLIIPCYYVNRFESPLKGFMDNDNFKLYLSDIGLFIELLGINYANILLDEYNMFKGAIAENYVATELIKNGWNLFYYQKPQVIEMDFLIDTAKGVIPIEVKANDNVKSSSLNKFMKENKKDFGIRISTKNFGFENNIKSVPLYAVFCITESNL